MTSAPHIDLDIFSDGCLDDPWPGYRMIREAGPVVRLEQELYDAYAIGRFADVRSALRDWGRFSSAQGIGFNDLANQISGGTVVGCDPPLHDQLRAVMLEHLSVSEVRGMADVVQQRADTIVAELVGQGRFDAVSDLAGRMVPAVLGELLGISGEVLDSFAHAGRAVFDAMGIANARMEESFAPLMALLEQLGSLRKEDMAPGSMGWDLFAAAERGEIPDDMTTNLLLNYVGPGFETTINAIGSAIWLLARDPEQWKKLKHDPSLVPSAVNEALRMEAPIQIWGRYCEGGTEVDGVEIPPGSRVAILLGSANRDGRHYPDPDHFDVTRNPADHLAFGHGIHHCIGLSLARTELSAVLAGLVEQVTTLECGDPIRRLNNTTRGLGSLPVVVS